MLSIKCICNRKYVLCILLLLLKIWQCYITRSSPYSISKWTASSEFGTYRLCEQRRFWRDCADAQSSEGSGETARMTAHPRSLARTFAARSYKQWVKRNLQTESQIPGPSQRLGMRSYDLSWRDARRHKFAWRGSNTPSHVVKGTNKPSAQACQSLRCSHTHTHYMDIKNCDCGSPWTFLLIVLKDHSPHDAKARLFIILLKSWPLAVLIQLRKTTAIIKDCLDEQKILLRPLDNKTAKVQRVTFVQGYLSRLMIKPTKWLCAQRRLRSARASAQSYHSILCALNGYLRNQTFVMRTAKTLIRLGGCPGWYGSSLGAQTILLVLSWGGSFVFPDSIKNWATSRENLSSGFFDQVRLKPTCAATEAS